MRVGPVVVAVVVGLLGLVWLGQGVGLIGGSFMTGQRTWAVIGAVLVLVALAILAWARRGGRSA